MKRSSGFIDNFSVGLKAWQANMDMKSAFNDYKTATYTRQYFSTTVDQRPQVVKQAAKEAFGNNTHHHNTLKTITKAYL